MIRTKCRKPSLGQARKPFLGQRDKKSVNPAPRVRLLIIQPNIRTTDKREVHQALRKNKVGEHHHGWAKVSYSRSLTGKPDDIKITPNAPRQVLPIKHASQLILKKPSIPIRIRAIDTCKGPSEMIFNVF